jgi:hypothetical protein
MSVDTGTPKPTESTEHAGTGELSAEQLTTDVAVAVGRAFAQFTDKRQRARKSLYGLSMSGLGGCRRKAAYQLAQVEPSDPELATTGENRAANLGTMIHEGLLPELAEVLGGHEEIQVELTVDTDSTTVVVPGRSDMYWPASKILLDLKTVGEHKLGQVVATGPYGEHRIQVAGYALAAEQAGNPVHWIGWIYVDRGTGASYVVIEPFTDDVRRMVTDKCQELVNYAESPHDAPRDGAGPGERTANLICNGCPWLRACWGEDAKPGVAGVQSSKVDDFGGMQEVLMGYLGARDAESAAKDRKDFFRELIVGNKPGTYGKTRWFLTKPSSTVDKNACAKLVDESGEPLPMRRTEPRLVVAWVAPDQTRGAGQQ